MEEKAKDVILCMENISKSFAAVQALKRVDFQVKRGEIHALVGENGAGKSTLMKILSGVYPYGTYGGKIIVNGEEQHFHTVRDAEQQGISIIYQELNIIHNLNICENIFLGHEQKHSGCINWNAQYKTAEELLAQVGLNKKPTDPASTLSVGQQQLVEISKALHKDVKILILDEPTSSLSEHDVDNLMGLLRELKKRGIACIYISHKLEEVFALADTITVIRDGESICTRSASEMDEDKIIYHMVGRELSQRFPIRQPYIPGEDMLQVENWSVRHPRNPDRMLLDKVNMHLQRGEIVGMAGLVGAGRTELALSLFGLYKPLDGAKLFLDGKPSNIKNPQDAIRQGLCYLTEDRKKFGLLLNSDIKTNMSISNLRFITHRGVINSSEEVGQTYEYIEKMQIKTSSITQLVKNLSGGNQQKVVLAKWMLAKPKILILDEPTRGIDVGAKYEIYQIIQQLADKGVAILIISSELPEILGICERIYVMGEGKIRGEFQRSEATQEKILACAERGVLR